MFTFDRFGAHFNARMQNTIIDELLHAARLQQFRLHFVASDNAQVRVLVSWQSERNWATLRNSIRCALARRLDREFRRRDWFAKRLSRRRVKDPAQFAHLVNEHLPGQWGWKWREGTGYFNACRTA